MICEQIICLIVCSFAWMLSGIRINVIPEFLNNKHFAHIEKQCGIPCEYFKEHESPDAEFYIVMHNGNIIAAVQRNSSAKIRIIGSHEGQHYHPLLELEYLRNHFEGTATLNTMSEIPWLIIWHMDKIKEREILLDKLPKISFVARNCNPMSERNHYVKIIDAKVGVVSLSSCMGNTQWPDCNGAPCSKVEAIRPYKIHLAFENGNSPGYVTEKIFGAFEAGVLPVWMGTRDVVKVVPYGSYIDVADFNTPDDVANYLKLVLENETLYNSYFEWKYKPFDPEYVRNNRALWTDSVFCRICHYVDTLQRGLEWDHQRQRAKIINDNNNSSLPRNPALHHNFIRPYSNEALTIFFVCILLLLFFCRKFPLRVLLKKLFSNAKSFPLLSINIVVIS